MKTSGHDHRHHVAGLAAAAVAIGLLRLFGTSNHVIVALSLALLEPTTTTSASQSYR